MNEAVVVVLVVVFCFCVGGVVAARRLLQVHAEAGEEAAMEPDAAAHEAICRRRRYRRRRLITDRRVDERRRRQAEHKTAHAAVSQRAEVAVREIVAECDCFVVIIGTTTSSTLRRCQRGARMNEVEVAASRDQVGVDTLAETRVHVALQLLLLLLRFAHTVDKAEALARLRQTTAAVVTTI